MSFDERGRIKVLGSAAGGGSPQWNCNCEVCRRVRVGDGVLRRTQTSIAVSPDAERWVVINASPDLGEQLLNTPELQPQKEGRHSPIETVVLTGGEVDQVAGLLTMREGEAFSLYASASTHRALEESVIFEALDRELVPRRRLEVDEPTELVDGSGQPLDVVVEPFAVPGKVPLYKEKPGEVPQIGESTEDNVALRIEVGGRECFFIPCCADITEELKSRIQGAALLFFDGTLWRDDELIAAGLGHKTGHRMGHVSIGGPEGAMARLADVDVGRKVFIHINNSNPVLLEDTVERRLVEEAGWEVAWDGMEF